MKFSSTTVMPKEEARTYADQIIELERKIKDLNEAKSAIYQRIKANYNPTVKDGFKEAIRLISMDRDKRLKVDAATEHTQAFLLMLEGPDAEAEWKAQRERDRAKPFPDPDSNSQH